MHSLSTSLLLILQSSPLLRDEARLLKYGNGEDGEDVLPPDLSWQQPAAVAVDAAAADGGSGGGMLALLLPEDGEHDAVVDLAELSLDPDRIASVRFSPPDGELSDGVHEFFTRAQVLHNDGDMELPLHDICYATVEQPLEGGWPQVGVAVLAQHGSYGHHVFWGATVVRIEYAQIAVPGTFHEVWEGIELAFDDGDTYTWTRAAVRAAAGGWGEFPLLRIRPPPLGVECEVLAAGARYNAVVASVQRTGLRKWFRATMAPLRALAPSPTPSMPRVNSSRRRREAAAAAELAAAAQAEAAAQPEVAQMLQDEEEESDSDLSEEEDEE